MHLRILTDSTCSRASCSICSNSSNEKESDEEEEEENDNKEEEEEIYSEESEDSRKEKPTELKLPKRHHYKKASTSQIPPLPIVHPNYNIKNTLVSSYKRIPSANKTDYSLISPSFDTSNDILTTVPFNHSSHISNPFLATTSFNKSLYNTNFTSTNVTDIVDDPSAFNNVSDDLMTTSFGSVSLSESTEMIGDDRSNDDFNTGISYDKSLLNEIPYSFNGSNINTVTNHTQDNSFISTAFNKPMYESEDIRSNYLASSLDAVDNNIMSTSFSTQPCASLAVSHSNSCNALTTNRFEETTSSLLARNVKSSKISDKLLTRILIDADTFTSTEQSAPLLDNTSNNLMSTSFNYPESNTKDSDIAFSDAFNNENDQSIKLQRCVVQEKETDVVVPPPVSALSSSLTNYLHNLPRKNYPLSRSTPGLTELDESVQKFSRIHTSPHVLQKQNSACNITQKTSTSFRTYRYNYDLDYIPVFHDGIRDDTDLRTIGGKFGLSQNSHLTYDAHRLFENRHLSKSIQNNVNTNISKETKVFSNVPPLPVINAANSKLCSACPPFTESASVNSNEKPKVKFSDTVTHILVPGTVCR